MLVRIPSFRFAGLRSGRPEALKSLQGGAAIVLATVVAGNLIRLISSMTLTRLLDASVFGVVGMLVTITFIITMISDAGVYPYVVRHVSADDPTFLDEVWTARLCRGAILTVAMVVLAVPIARITDKEELSLAIAVWSLTFLIDGMTSMAFATSVLKGQLIRLNGMELITSCVQITVSVCLSIFFKSYWSIVVAMLIASLVKVQLSYSLFRPSVRKWNWSIARVKDIWLFSKYIAASGTLSVVLSQSDKLVFAKVMSLEQLGIYTLAVSLSILPLAVVSPYVHQVLYPAFARGLVDGKDPSEVFYKNSFRVTMVYVFATGAFIGLAGLLVELLYDPRYAGVTIFLRLLSLTALMAMQTWASDQFMIAAGRVRSTMVGHLVRASWLAAAGMIAWQGFGIMGLVYAVSTMEISAYFYFLFERSRLSALSIKYEISFVLSALLGILLGSGVELWSQYITFIN